MGFLRKLADIVIFIGIFPIIFATDVPPNTCVEEQVLDLFTKWRHGDPLPLPLPPLKEIKLQSLAGQFAGYGIKVAYSTGAMSLKGLSNFTVNELLVSTDQLFKASGVILFPSLALTADSYDIKGNAYVFYSLKGSGLMNITFQNVTLTYGISLRPNATSGDEGTQVDDIRLNYAVEAIHVDLEGSSWPINKVLNTEGKNIIESYRSLLIDGATERVRRSLNTYLSAVSPEQLTNAFVTIC